MGGNPAAAPAIAHRDAALSPRPTGRHGAIDTARPAAAAGEAAQLLAAGHAGRMLRGALTTRTPSSWPADPSGRRISLRHAMAARRQPRRDRGTPRSERRCHGGAIAGVPCRMSSGGGATLRTSSPLVRALRLAVDPQSCRRRKPRHGVTDRRRRATAPGPRRGGPRGRDGRRAIPPAFSPATAAPARAWRDRHRRRDSQAVPARPALLQVAAPSRRHQRWRRWRSIARPVAGCGGPGSRLAA